MLRPALTMNRRPSARGFVAAALLSTLAVAAALPPTPAVAQVRALPDFTDLVEQAGPSVVNIRTIEKSRGNAVRPNARMSACCE